jgi:hypothetical protein
MNDESTPAGITEQASEEDEREALAYFRNMQHSHVYRAVDGYCAGHGVSARVVYPCDELRRAKVALSLLSRIRSEGGGEKREATLAEVFRLSDRYRGQWETGQVERNEHVTVLADLWCALDRLRALAPSGEKGWQQGAEAMREALARVWDEWINLPAGEFNARMDSLPHSFSEVIRALPIPEVER